MLTAKPPQGAIFSFMCENIIKEGHHTYRKIVTVPTFFCLRAG